MLVETDNREAWRRLAHLLSEIGYDSLVLLNLAERIANADASGKRMIVRSLSKNDVSCAAIAMLICPAILQVIEVRTQDTATEEN